MTDQSDALHQHLQLQLVIQPQTPKHYRHHYHSRHGSGNWEMVPSSILESIIAMQDDLTLLLNCMLVCKKWYFALNDERSEIWRIMATRKLSKSVVKSNVLSSLSGYKGKLRAWYYSWDPNECSRNIYIKSNGFTLHRNPVAQSTDAAKGKIGFFTGRHCWEVCWDGPLGTVAVIGIATKEASVQSQGYVALIGSNNHSWGWNLVENNLLHNGHCVGNYPRLNNAPRYQTGDRIRVILDCDSQTLAFERDYEFLGIAFFSLPKKLLYPAVSAVYGNTEISMVYLGYPLDG